MWRYSQQSADGIVSGLTESFLGALDGRLQVGLLSVLRPLAAALDDAECGEPCYKVSNVMINCMLGMHMSESHSTYAQGVQPVLLAWLAHSIAPEIWPACSGRAGLLQLRLQQKAGCHLSTVSMLPGAGTRQRLLRKLLAFLTLKLPSMSAFPPSSQNVATRAALDMVQQDLQEHGPACLAHAHIYGPLLSRWAFLHHCHPLTHHVYIGSKQLSMAQHQHVCLQSIDNYQKSVSALKLPC